MSNAIVADLQRLDQAFGRADKRLNISVDAQLQIPVARSADGTCIRGTVAIGHHVVTTTKDQHVARQFSQALNHAEKAAVLQWTEYRVNRIDGLNNAVNRRQTLEELNGHLERRSYLIGSKCTAADLIVCLGLHAILSRMNLLEREAFPHLGRWFAQVQRNFVGRDKQQLPWNPKVVFSKTPL